LVSGFFVLDLLRFSSSTKASPLNPTEIKKVKKFKGWELVRISRLSVMPVPKETWQAILKMSQS